MSVLAGCDISWIGKLFSSTSVEALQNATVEFRVVAEYNVTLYIDHFVDLGGSKNLSSPDPLPYETLISILSNASCSTIDITSKSPPIYPWVFAFPRMLVETDEQQCYVEILANHTLKSSVLQWPRTYNVSYSNCTPTVVIDSLGGTISGGNAVFTIQAIWYAIIVAMAWYVA
ncbi:hypothetical protein HDU83_000585 [Entophlyctis luteolus]|nr:hypothetical protein HDU83_000585 [Entophlyctis luteolus]